MEQHRKVVGMFSVDGPIKALNAWCVIGDVKIKSTIVIIGSKLVIVDN